MRLFDLHCDTLTECIKRGECLAATNGHISLERGMNFERWAQVFAVFVPETLRGSAAATYANNALDFFECQRGDVLRACAPVLAVENGSALGEDLANLDYFHARGVKIITLTWNGANALGHGSRCGPALGLTDFGKSAVKRMFELGVIPDVSHLNEAGFRDVAALAAEHGKPFWATHSNCGAIRPHPRNLSDEQMKAIFDSGGLVGLTLFVDFLGGAGTPLDAARHLEHMLELGGEDNVALGSDFDGCVIHPSLAGIEHMEIFDSELERFGFSESQREKFFWANAARELFS